MPIPFLIPLLIAGGAAAGQTLLGVGQSISAAAKRRKAERFFQENQYEIPEGVKSMLDVVSRVASQRELPGADVLRQRQAATVSQGVETAQRAGQSSSDVLGALQGLYGKQLAMQQDLAIASAQNWQRNQFQLANALNTMGQYETQKWNYNVMYPYMQRMTAAGQTAAAGSENIAGGIGSLMNVGMAGAQMSQDQSNFDKWYNAKGLGTASTAVPASRMSGNYFQNWWSKTQPMQYSPFTQLPEENWWSRTQPAFPYNVSAPTYLNIK